MSSSSHSDTAQDSPITLAAISPETKFLFPTPPKGFPIIHGLTLTRALAFVEHTTQREWTGKVNSAGAVIIHFPFFGSSNNVKKKMDALANKASKAINKLFNRDEVSVVSPTLIEFPNRLSYRPTIPFLVEGLTTEERRTLIRPGCWALEDSVFFVHNAELPFTSFVGTFFGIARDPSEETNLLLAAEVRSSLQQDGLVRDLIEEHHDNVPDPVNDPVGFIMDSVRIEGLKIRVARKQGARARTMSVFNVFVSPPSADEAIYDKWHQMLRARRFSTKYGPLLPKESSFHCNVCKSRAHPTGLCPFTLIKGWPVKCKGKSVTDVYEGGDFSDRGRGKGESHRYRPY